MKLDLGNRVWLLEETKNMLHLQWDQSPKCDFSSTTFHSREKDGFSQGCGLTKRVWQKQRGDGVDGIDKKRFTMELKLGKVGREDVENEGSWIS